MFEARMAAMEGAEAARATASGMAAVTAAMMGQLRAGDHVVAARALFGSCRWVIDEWLPRFGVATTTVDGLDLAQWAAAVRPDTKSFFLETPTNPTLKVVDIEAIVARKKHALVVVDNTFATPVVQRPLELGADAVVHSTTKYLGGHSDTVGGAVIVRDPELHEQVRFVQNSVGAVPGPLDCFLVHRGLRTLHLRVAAHTESARVVSEYLLDQPRVEDVRWPGFGGMVSFRHPAAVALATATNLFTLAESLGGVESLIEVPQAMTHQSVEGSAAAVPADLVRLSCGVEAPEDLVEDLSAALSAVAEPAVASL